MADPVSPTVYIDADACPVKEDTFRVAKRYGLRVLVVCNRAIVVPRAPWIELVVAGSGFDAVDEWIVGHVAKNDIVVTSDILLAARLIERGARPLDPRGRLFTEDNIGEVKALRHLADELRQRGALDLGPKKMGTKHRSTFLSSLDELINAVLRGK